MSVDSKRRAAWRRVISLGAEYSRHKEQSKAKTAKFIREITDAVNKAQGLDGFDRELCGLGYRVLIDGCKRSGTRHCKRLKGHKGECSAGEWLP